MHDAVALMFMTLVAATSCTADKYAQCTKAESCDLMAHGQCVETNGDHWCAYPDTGCPGSGLRYSEYGAGEGLAGTCVASMDESMLLDARHDALEMDGAIDGPRTWDPPFAIAMTSHTEWGPAMSRNGLELYFSADLETSGDLDIYVARRSSVDSPFGEGQRLVRASVVGVQEVAPVLSSNDLTLWYAAKADERRGYDILALHRDTVESDWLTAPYGGNLNTDHDEFPGTFASGDATMIFVREDGTAQQRGPQSYDLYEAYRIVGDTWMPGRRLSEISMADFEESGPSLSGDGLRLYFAAARPEDGKGLDIYVAEREGLFVMFDKPTLVSELSSSDDDRDVWIARDEQAILFASNRNMSSGMDIYEARRHSVR